jgi:DoxX-like protein
MQSGVQTTSASRNGLWAGSIVSALMVLFLMFDGGIKVMKLAPAVEGTTRLGYPASIVLPLGIVELVCLFLYVVPRTSILGAILLTGYLGGATATQVRLRDPWFLFPVAVGALVWLGPFLRDHRLRALIPTRR